MNKNVVFFTLAFLILFISGCSQSKHTTPLQKSDSQEEKTNLSDKIEVSQIEEIKISFTKLPVVPNPDIIKLVKNEEYFMEFYNVITKAEIYDGPKKDVASNYDIVVVYKNGTYQIFQYWNRNNFGQIKDVQTSRIYLLDNVYKQKLDNLLEVTKDN